MSSLLAGACAVALAACGGGAVVQDASVDASVSSSTDAGGDDATAEAGGDDGATSGEDGGLVAACPDPAPSACPDPPLHYPDVAPIIEQRCVTCHFDGAADWPLTTYQDVASWWTVVYEDLMLCTMPPPESPTGLTPGERQAILSWIACGFPQ